MIGKKIMILGASELQLPMIKRAHELGLQTGVIDRDPRAPGAALADHFFEISTTDGADVLRAARQFRPEGITTAATDMPVRTQALVAESLGLRGPSQNAALSATDKWLMNQRLVAGDVSTPRSVKIGSPDQLSRLYEWNFPLIMKPVDSSGSRGVTLVRSPGETSDAYLYGCENSRSGEVIAQEFVQGVEVSVEGFVDRNEVLVVAVTDKVTTGPPHFVEIGHSQPSKLDPLTLQRVEDTARQAVNALELADCGFHAEIIVADGLPYLIELGARLGGDFISSHLVPLSTGVDLVGNVIRIALGERPSPPVGPKGAGVARFFLTPGDPTGLDSVRRLPDVAEVALARRAGSNVIRNSTERSGHVITFGATVEDAIAAAERAASSLGICDPRRRQIWRTLD